MYLAGTSGLGDFTVNGVPAASATVGDVLGFDFPGSGGRIWLTQYHNGAVQFDGPFSVPMPPYTLQPQDAGNYTGQAFVLNPDGSKGALYRSWTFIVAPQQPVQVTPPPQTTGTPITITLPKPVSTLPTGINVPVSVYSPATGPSIGPPAPTPAPTTDYTGLLILGGAMLLL